ncbi:TetR/AcrR family transcriptional regulator [Egicoccus sp. AB-alg6-2]|uniref:TetR/AcrR family transcriptional regulator n=1 Tax=Egicoccus sp. AB-alg6-2 TaxID=3242692 RepID=UPI00359D13C9
MSIANVTPVGRRPFHAARSFDPSALRVLTALDVVSFRCDDVPMSGTRTYRMSARAAATEATRKRIAEAAERAFMERWYDDVTIRDVAAAAGVALQTVLNHFPTKDALFAAAAERLASSIENARWPATPGAVRTAVTTLVDDYERTGESSLRMLAVEERVPAVRPWLDFGRRRHEAWVEQTFAAALDGLQGKRRTRRLAQLVVATDVYTWKLLRHDKRLSRQDTITAVCELVTALHELPEAGAGS